MEMAAALQHMNDKQPKRTSFCQSLGALINNSDHDTQLLAITIKLGSHPAWLKLKIGLLIKKTTIEWLQIRCSFKAPLAPEL